MSDPMKHLLVCATTAALASAGALMGEMNEV